MYFYGSRAEVLERLCDGMRARCPGLKIAGAEPSRFRKLTAEEQAGTALRIRESGARILFAGLGCPRQEVFAYEMSKLLPMPILAVGAAFDYYSGLLSEPPAWMQRGGVAVALPAGAGAWAAVAAIPVYEQPVCGFVCAAAGGPLGALAAES